MTRNWFIHLQMLQKTYNIPIWVHWCILPIARTVLIFVGKSHGLICLLMPYNCCYFIFLPLYRDASDNLGTCLEDAVTDPEVCQCDPHAWIDYIKFTDDTDDWVDHRCNHPRSGGMYPFWGVCHLFIASFFPTY